MAKAKDLTKNKVKKKRSEPKSPGSAFARNISRLLDDEDHGLSLRELARLSGSPISTVHGWQLGHNPKIDSIHRLLKNLEAQHGIVLDFKEFLTGEPPHPVQPQLRPEDLFEEGGIVKTGIFKVSLVELVPKGQKLPKGKK